MSQHDLSWSIPVMRAGYAGRGLVYLAVAGFSLYAVWRGGQAQEHLVGAGAARIHRLGRRHPVSHLRGADRLRGLALYRRGL